MFASPEPETGCAALDYEPRASLASLWPQNSGNRTKGDIGGDCDLGFCPKLCPVLCDRKFAAAWVGIGGGARPRRPGFGTPTLRSSESRWNRVPPNRVQSGVNILRGTTESERKALVRKWRGGELHRLHPNTYIPTAEWHDLDATARRRVTHLSAVDSREGMVVVGRSAALAWGLDIFDRSPNRDGGRPGPKSLPSNIENRPRPHAPSPTAGIDVIELAHPTRRNYQTRGAIHERKLTWGPEDLRRVEGRLVTSVGATVADVTLRHGFDHGLVAADSALRLGYSQIDLARAAGRSANPRMALDVVACASRFADSAAESLMRAQIIEAGLPAPELQLRVFSADGLYIGCVDLAYRGLLAMIEVHGKGKFLGVYGDSDKRSLYEWKRESELLDEGLAVLRVTWEQIMSGEALRRVREFLEAQRAKVAAGDATTARFVRAGDRWPKGFRMPGQRPAGAA